MNTEELKALGFTHVYRTPKGELWGVKLIAGKPVWHRIPEKAP